jgi:hypothetical protein
MCEVLSPGGAAHESNGRATIEDDDNDFWFGFEQEYFCGIQQQINRSDFLKAVSPDHRVLTIAQ